MRLITACALIDDMDAISIWKFWTSATRNHFDYCRVAYGYPYECTCQAPAWWVFPYDVRYTYDVARTGNFKYGAPENSKPVIDDWW